MVENMKEEIWKDVPDYEGYYQASNLGRVRSLDRTVTYSNGRRQFYKGRIRDGSIGKDGYRQTTLSINGTKWTFRFSQIVAMAFLGHELNGHVLVVDHINGDKSDDRVENLRIVTHRANTTTCFRSDRDSFTSGHVGVNWDEGKSKWRAQIRYNSVQTNLGYYDTEIEASNTYQLAISEIKDGSFNPDDYKREWTSKYKGVSFHKASQKWQSQTTINGKRKHLGCYHTELEAYKARLKAEKEQKSA